MIEQRLADGKLLAGSVVPNICRAMRAFAGEDYAACVAQLEGVLGEVVRIGGSHAQREIIEDTFIVALIRVRRITPGACAARRSPAPPPLAARCALAGDCGLKEKCRNSGGRRAPAATLSLFAPKNPG